MHRLRVDQRLERGFVLLEFESENGEPLQFIADVLWCELQDGGCYGSGHSRKLAEIVAAALLGGEISMGAAIASGEFAAAHEYYGRNRPGEGQGN